MIFALIALNGITVLSAFLLLHRQQKTAEGTLRTVLSAHRLELAGFLDRQTKEREKHREEVQALCQRLQAPELAVASHNAEQAGPVDRAYASGLEMPLSDEEIADNLELIRRMERDANAMLGDQAVDGMP